jgi:hypothetical protein
MSFLFFLLYFSSLHAYNFLPTSGFFFSISVRVQRGEFLEIVPVQNSRPLAA